MKNKFDVTGLFYEIKGYKFRKFLNIIKKNSNCQKPDLMVVMMNPGSSRPIDGKENCQIEVDTIPGNTQKQIMHIMTNCDFQYARVLNLSDLREPKSSVFLKRIKELDNNNISHSIFSSDRENDFDELFVKDVPVIFAWGVNRRLSKLALTAMKNIGKTTPIGLNKEGLEYAFYHPLPRYNKQKEWVQEITKMIKK